MKYEVLKYFKFLKERVLKWLILFILLLIIYLIIKISNSFKTFDDITKLLIIFNFKDKELKYLNNLNLEIKPTWIN